jgi:hypothetical protein
MEVMALEQHGNDVFLMFASQKKKGISSLNDESSLDSTADGFEKEQRAYRTEGKK